MSARRTLAALQKLGGRASLRELEAVDYNASDRLARLMRQGYVERIGRGLYQLTAAGLLLPRDA